jgi:hypothetical protein
MSDAWKDLERTVAVKLGGRRKLRGANFAEEDFDVDVPDMPHWRIDAKYRAKHAHHSKLHEVRKKYCKDATAVPLLVTKARGERGEVVSMSLDDFASLLAAFRAARDEAKSKPTSVIP